MKYLPLIVAVILVGMAALFWAFGSAIKGVMCKECQYNLRLSIGVRCREYAAEHHDQFPNTWADLGPLEKGSTWDRVFCCPCAGHTPGAWERLDLWSDYHLLPGRSTNDPATTVLVIEPLANHSSKGANVLFVDGRTAWWPALRVLTNNRN